MKRLALAALCVLTASCQLVLGFEDHELAPSGGGPTGGGGSTTSIGGEQPTGGMPTTGGGGTGAEGGEGGEGGMPEPVLFGTPDAVEELGPIRELEMDDAGTLFILEEADTTFRIQRRMSDTLEVLREDLEDARGLALTADRILTTTGPSSVADLFCHVFAIDKAGVAAEQDVVAIPCVLGTSQLYAVGAAGSHIVFSRLEPSGNTRSKVLRAEITDFMSQGTVIGLGIDKDIAVPSALVVGNDYVWIDSAGGALLQSAGGTVSGPPPPGPGVVTVASLSNAKEVVRRASLFFVATSTAILRIDSSGDVVTLASATNPRGLSVDAAFVYWAEPTRVRALRLADGATTTVDEPADVATSTAGDGTAAFYGTEAGRLVRVPHL